MKHVPLVGAYGRTSQEIIHRLLELNGSNSLVNQTWKGTDIVCVLWAMNNAKDVAYAQSAGSTPLRTFNTAATTNT